MPSKFYRREAPYFRSRAQPTCAAKKLAQGKVNILLLTKSTHCSFLVCKNIFSPYSGSARSEDSGKLGRGVA